MCETQTIAAAMRQAVQRLADSGVESARLDGRALTMLATGLGLEQLLAEPERPIDPCAIFRLDGFINRRCRREPVSRIRGSREFYGRNFTISPATLDPRPDSETLIDVALKAASILNRPVRLADLGTGSGALLVTLLCELPNAQGVGTDCCLDALQVARANAGYHRVDERAIFAAAYWTQGLAGGFDLVVANPPYIPSADIVGLDLDVAGYDPHVALDGGHDGLSAYRAIAAHGLQHLARGGVLALEVGAGQAEAVETILDGSGFGVHPRIDPVTADFTGHNRVVCRIKKGAWK